MSIVCSVIVIYITLDLIASAYVVRRLGGIKSAYQQVRKNLGLTTSIEDEDDVYDRY